MRATREWVVVVAMLLLAASARAADWPQYRADAGRTGYTPEQLPANLQLQWTFKPACSPQVSWPGEARVVYDHANHVVVAGKIVLFGSTADCQMHALDTATGAEKWVFFTSGPIRCPPAIWKDKVLAACDDGFLYCLSLADGRLVWKKRGGPDDAMVVGNGRVISKWPARGGPAVADGVVYFAAGLWPADGAYLYALDVETGKEIWCNKDAGGLSRVNPHTSAAAETGIGFQGPIAVSGELILVPTGRSLAAAFDRRTGAFRYFKTLAQGGTAVAAVDGLSFDGGYIFDAGDGKEVSRGISPLAMAAGPDCIAYNSSVTIAVLDRARPIVTTKVSATGPDVRRLNTKWTLANDKAGGAAMIIAGNRIYSAGGAKVVAVDMASRAVAWSATVDAIPWGLAAADGRLFVSTASGAIYCFGDQAGGQVIEAKPRADVYGPLGPYAQAADEILKLSGLTDGYCVDLGCGDGRLAFELARRSNLIIFGVEKDPVLAADARRKLARAGLYGTRVIIHEADPARTGYPKQFANLVVSARSALAGADSVDGKEASRIQRPWGGTVCIGRPGKLRTDVRGPLEGAGQWTHQYGSAAATASSDDLLVRGPLTVRWFTGSEMAMPNRHGRPPAPLFFEGVLYVMGMDGLVALDACNGRTIWQSPFAGIGRPYDGDDLLGSAGTNSTFCVSAEGVFVREGGQCVRLDRATGKRSRQFDLPAPNKGVWGFIATEGGALFGSVAVTDHPVPYYYVKSDTSRLYTESKGLFALDAVTGKPLWQFQPRNCIGNNAIVIGGGRAFVIDRELAEEQPRYKKLIKPHAPGELVCLDARTGREVWRAKDGIWGTVLSLSVRHNVLLMSGQPAFNGFGLTSDQVSKLAAFDAATGKPLWQCDAQYMHRPVVIGRTIYLNRNKLDLVTGQMQDWRLVRSHGCGMVIGSANLLLFRSAVLGYADLLDGGRVRHFGGVRPGCWVNAIPAGGLVLMPDSTAKCACSYDNKACLGLEARDAVGGTSSALP